MRACKYKLKSHTAQGIICGLKHFNSLQTACNTIAQQQGHVAVTVPEAACTSSSYILHTGGEAGANIAEDMQNVNGTVPLTCVGTGPTKVSSARLGDLPPLHRFVMLEVPFFSGLATGWRFWTTAFGTAGFATFLAVASAAALSTCITSARIDTNAMLQRINKLFLGFTY